MSALPSDRAVAASPSSPSVSPVPASIPSAMTLRNEAASNWLRLGRHLAEWGSDYDWIDTEPSADLAMAFLRRSETCLLLAAQAIEAGTAETQGGSVHESAVATPCAPSPQSAQSTEEPKP